MVAYLITLTFILPHVAIHELGHVLAAVFVHSRIKRIGLNWTGPHIVREAASTGYKNALVAFAGPAANLYTCLVMIVNHQHFAWIPLELAVINLLPIKYSDLSNALKYLRMEKSAVVAH